MSQSNYDPLKYTKNSQQINDDKYEVLKNKIKDSFFEFRINPNLQDLSIYSIKSLEEYSKHYKNEQIQDSILKISLENKIWLGIRGDGNCFYRSIIILYLLELFKSYDVKELDKFITRVKRMKNITINNNLYNTNTEVLQYIFICFLYHIKNMREKRNTMNMEYIIEQYNCRPEVDFSAIVICRNLIFQTFESSKTHPSFSFFIEEQMQSQIPKMLLQYFEYAEDIIIPLASQAFRCNLLVQNLYRQSSTSINTEKLLYQPFDQRQPIFTTLNVLFTKGHYESLISTNQVNSFEQFYKIKAERLYFQRYSDYKFYSDIISQLKKEEEIQLNKKIETQAIESIELTPNDQEDVAQLPKQIKINNFTNSIEGQFLQQKKNDEQSKKQENSNQIFQQNYPQKEQQNNQYKKDNYEHEYLYQRQQESKNNNETQDKQSKIQNKQDSEENYEVSTEQEIQMIRQNSQIYQAKQIPNNQTQPMKQKLMEYNTQNSQEQSCQQIIKQEQQHTSKEQMKCQQKEIMKEQRLLQEIQNINSTTLKTEQISQIQVKNQNFVDKEPQKIVQSNTHIDYFDQKQKQQIAQITDQQKQITQEEKKSQTINSNIQTNQQLKQTDSKNTNLNSGQLMANQRQQNKLETQKSNNLVIIYHQGSKQSKCQNYQQCYNMIDLSRDLQFTKIKGLQNQGFLCQNCLKAKQSLPLDQQNLNQGIQNERENKFAEENNKNIKNEIVLRDNNLIIEQNSEDKQKIQSKLEENNKIKNQLETQNKKQTIQNQQFDDNISQQQTNILEPKTQQNINKLLQAYKNNCNKNQNNNNHQQIQDKVDLSQVDHSKQYEDIQKIQDQITSNSTKYLKRPQLSSKQDLIKNNQLKAKLSIQQDEQSQNIKVEQDKQSQFNSQALQQDKNISKNKHFRGCVKCQKNVLNLESDQKFNLSSAKEQLKQICKNCAIYLIEQGQIKQDSINIEGIEYKIKETFKQYITQNYSQQTNLNEQIQLNDDGNINQNQQKLIQEKINQKCDECKSDKDIKLKFQMNFYLLNDQNKKEQVSFICYDCMQLLINEFQEGQNYIKSNYDQNKMYIIDEKFQRQIKLNKQNIKGKVEENEEGKEEQKINQQFQETKQPIYQFEIQKYQGSQTQKQLKDISEDRESLFLNKNKELSISQIDKLKPSQKNLLMNQINRNVYPSEVFQNEKEQNYHVEDLSKCQSCPFNQENNLENDIYKYQTVLLKGDKEFKAMICGSCFQQMAVQNEVLPQDRTIILNEKKFKIDIESFQQQRKLMKTFLEIKEFQDNKEQTKIEKEIKQNQKFLLNEQNQKQMTLNSIYYNYNKCESCQTSVEKDIYKFDLLVIKGEQNLIATLCVVCFKQLAEEYKYLRQDSIVVFNKKQYIIKVESFDDQQFIIKRDSYYVEKDQNNKLAQQNKQIQLKQLENKYKGSYLEQKQPLLNHDIKSLLDKQSPKNIQRPTDSTNTKSMYPNSHRINSPKQSIQPYYFEQNIQNYTKTYEILENRYPTVIKDQKDNFNYLKKQQTTGQTYQQRNISLQPRVNQYQQQLSTKQYSFNNNNTDKNISHQNSQNRPSSSFKYSNNNQKNQHYYTYQNKDIYGFNYLRKK